MDEPKKPFAWLRRLLPWVTAMVVAALLYDGWIFYSRWSRERDRQRTQAREGAEQAAKQARKTFEMLGGDELSILNFYASPGLIRPGGHATLCYGVNGAKTVRIDPPVEELRPSVSRCLQVTPGKDTEYKLIAEDAAGHSVSRSFVLKVAR